MPDNRPRGRKKNVTGGGKGAFRRGSGLGNGPVGSGHLPGGDPGGGSSFHHRGFGRAGGQTRIGGKFSLILILLIVLFGGGGGLSSLLGGYGGSSGQGGMTGGASSYLQALSGGSASTGWTQTANTGRLDRTVSEKARSKYTMLKGGGKDTTTIMVYMCGTDLESQSGMATSDLTEMQNATISNNINLIVYTGGCSQWKNNVVSSRKNQIYQVKNGKVSLLSRDEGSVSMTDPATLTSFIKYCRKNFPADRYDLILWDHGGGSLTGYGYDEKYPRSGSMSLSGIDTALKDAGIRFDFIGFDACLMATVENAQMLSKYADYLLASEETEPGVGWYYSNWLTSYSADPSMETIDLGKKVIDDFISVCNQRCPGQQTTLSLVDLSELGQTLPESFRAFSSDTKEMIRNDEYAKVSGARSETREFARSSAIDQIDLVHFARLLDTEEGKALADALLGAVKYNRTSSNMTNAYGLSVYFPYQRVYKVDSAAKTYEEIGVDDEYTECIREFAGLEASGQMAMGGTLSPLSSLSDLLTQGSQVQGSDEILDILSLFMAGDRSIEGLDETNSDFLAKGDMTKEERASYIAGHQLDQENLLWKTSGDREIISMDEDQWSLVQGLNLCKYVDDGEGYIDLGMDTFDQENAFDQQGNLVGETDNTWISVNGQPVAYYHTDTVDDGDQYTITGYVPAKLNDEDVKLILIYDNDHENGYIAGAAPNYAADLTETQARGLREIKDGDRLEFYCDYYSYKGEYLDTYYLGDPLEVSGDLVISDTAAASGDRVKALYRFTDIYNQQYYSQLIPVINEVKQDGSIPARDKRGEVGMGF